MLGNHPVFLVTLLALSSHVLANPCPDNLTWNAVTNMCETMPLSELMNFHALDKSDEGKKKMRAMCDQMAIRYGITQTLWLTPDRDKCAFCVPGTNYDNVSQICM